MNKQLKNIEKLLKQSESFKNIISRLETESEVRIRDAAGSLLSLMITSISETTNRKTVFVSNNIDKLDDIYHDIKLIGFESPLNLVKEPQATLRSRVNNTGSALDWLIEGLMSFSRSESGILLCQPDIFQYQIPSNEIVEGHYKKIEKGQTFDFDSFIKELILNGFERMDYVSGQGQIAVRGGIVDLFPIGWDNPVRIEFWGNDIESLREFEVISQRSIREFDSIEYLDSMFSDGPDNEDSDKSAIDFIGDDILLMIDETVDTEELNNIITGHDFKKIFLSPVGSYNLGIKSFRQPQFASSIKFFISEMNKFAVENYKIFLACEGHIHLDRFKNLVYSTLDDQIENAESDNYLSPKVREKLLIWDTVSLSRGFFSEELKVAYYTEHEVFERHRIYDTQQKKKSKGLTIKELQDLRIGDYVVHEDKGIGIFDGFQTITIADSKQDCARVRFADGDMLYVHLNYIGKLSKYSAQEGSAPVLTKLGSGEWLRRRAKTKKRLKDIARDLIKLYAERKAQRGFAFPADTIWQKEFEAAFIYEDTPDQVSSTEDVKSDMESISPMDRLVCGDVGFGKTEVAIRAAFKAVQAGKQVAVLVPTTILAQQHYMSFKDRLSKYPVNIDVISRFRSKKEQSQITEKLQRAGIDILIGTHRILSKDIIFKNLGLLVVDEEHRFGVSHKEKLRQMKANVDTLTMTATPIPRTLNFSLMGARDLSLIETPPRNRIPVLTEILEWDNNAIVQAINSEIERGGQVFFVSDRIDDIEKIAAEMKTLLPHLNFAVGHGQMRPSELEDIMEKFIEGKYDVLVATKIIESGIDIPNANTILINRAHNFGLAELYQLRGRVGRSNVQAYCYLLIPPAHKLPQKSIQRLQAIEEFSELGSGFKLSMRDMEIRGAGNLLGAEQSGFIIDIGFELYQKVLGEAVNELKTGEFADIFGDAEVDDKPKYLNEEIVIEIDEDALFPADYISGDTERFMYYKKLYTLNDNFELDDVIKEITDKYGKLPKEARNLIFVVRLRIASMATGFSRIIVKKTKLICEFPSRDLKDYYDEVFPQIIDYLNQTDGIMLNQSKEKLFLEIPLDNRSRALEYIWKIKRIIEMSGEK
ncbi:MAG: transcription-repair coupling factor [Candidatus Kapabacteria bacterium]|nr:transcription-repair coupling factor [Candidatus Kapabacteria bacterium]